MNNSMQIELTGLDLNKIEALAKVSGKSSKAVVEELIHEKLEDRSERIRQISERLMKEKQELYRRLAQ